MRYTTTTSCDASSVQADCILVPVFKSTELPSVTAALDEKLGGVIARRMAEGDMSGKAGQMRTLYELPNISAKKVILVGCGEKQGFSLDKLMLVLEKVAARLKSSNCRSAASFLLDGVDDQAAAATQTVLIMEDKQYRFDAYKSDSGKDKAITLEELILCGDGIDEAVRLASCIATGKKIARDLANHPGNICTPAFLAETAQQLDEEYASISTEVLGEAEMAELGMNSFLSVSKGSELEGKMISIQYQGGKDDAPVVLVGKGITFDTGGISLKPGAKMDEMKFDMGGAASVIGTLKAVAEMQLPLNVVGVIATAENMPSGIASKPGDIVTSMSGKTIEILNTDAEGRLVLCDALTWVEKFKPAVVIDIATLTGACIVALGHHISGLISNDDQLAEDLLDCGRQIHDEAWRLPYNDKYKKQLKSEFADLGNIGGPAAGTITAGCFLAAFTEDYRWAHLDIAGTAWDGKAATGRPVPLLTQYLISRTAS